MLPPVVVRAARIPPRTVLEWLPGQTSVVDMAPFRDRIATPADVLESVPGLHVSDYGGLGAFSTVSIRGSGANQVSVFLDGIPLARAGIGVTNLAELPFSGVDRVEVYRGFAPPELSGASLGGALNLVTRTARPQGPPLWRGHVTAGVGSSGTRRAGLSQEFVQGGWSGLVVADFLRSDGDFTFLDDNGTPLNPGDDAIVPRRNNWVRDDEVLARVGRALPHLGELQVLNQWVRHDQGIAGIASAQSDVARAGSTSDVTSAEARFPALWRGRLGLRIRLDHEWREDRFADPESDIGLGMQDNRDETQTWGLHGGTTWRLPFAQEIVADGDLRRQRYLPWRRFPQPAEGPAQQRRTAELGVEHRITLARRLGLHAGLRAQYAEDRFSGDLRTPYSLRPARAGIRRTLEPRFGFRLALHRTLQIRGAYGEYSRAPGFLELFGDGGSLAGSTDLVPEEGTNRDVGLHFAAAPRGVALRFGVARFHNTVDHLITLLPQSQRTFVARNIGAARMTGDEWSWSASAGSRRRWSLEGSYTRLDARDRGVDIRWYAGKRLPGRPARQLSQRVGVAAGPVEIGYAYDHLGDNALDRWNREIVARRDLHGLDARIAWRAASIQIGLRNLTDERAADVAGFPLPGRTLFATTTFRL